jgi:predicted NBD/HSP70 family sugar kinase
VSLSEKEQPKFFVGIDLGGEEHKVCLIAGSGELVEQRCFAHSGAAIGEFLDWLQQRTVVDPSTVAIAVEAPRGVIMEALLERRYAVFSINPKQLDRFRDRFSVAGAKDDRRDAFVLVSNCIN